MTQTNSYDLLKPFKYSKTTITFSVILLAFTIIGIPYFLWFFVTKDTLIIFSAMIIYFILAIIFEDRILWNTKIIGRINIDVHSIAVSERQFLFQDMTRLDLVAYLKWHKGRVPSWKFCNKLSIKLNDGTEHVFFISRETEYGTKNIFDLMDDVKRTNREYYDKIKVRRTWYEEG